MQWNQSEITGVKPSYVGLFVICLTQHEVIEVPLVRCRFKVRIVVKDKYGMGMKGMVINYGKFAAYGNISTRAGGKHWDVKYQGLNHSQNKEMFNNIRFNSKRSTSYTKGSSGNVSADLKVLMN